MMNHPTEFEVLPAHIALLERMYVFWDDSGYDGAPAVGLKRPYGNSDVLGDVMEIVYPGEYTEAYEADTLDDLLDERSDEIESLHRSMEFVVQIALNQSGRGEVIQPGIYYRPERYDTRTWNRR